MLAISLSTSSFNSWNAASVRILQSKSMPCLREQQQESMGRCASTKSRTWSVKGCKDKGCFPASLIVLMANTHLDSMVITGGYPRFTSTVLGWYFIAFPSMPCEQSMKGVDSVQSRFSTTGC